ncbi:hypothetical protein lerEdw1_020920 [Lerista edwardsae]|nr:hypothetical protein lerEdw1_020920 [Lerista edwardsae]
MPKQVGVEGQSVSLKCRAAGDPEPCVRRISPGGKLVSNTSQTVAYENGTLDSLVTWVGEQGTFTCVASNAEGESTAPLGLLANPCPHPADSTSCDKKAEPGPSDSLTPAKSGFPSETKPRPERKVAVAELSSSPVLPRWPSQRYVPGTRMLRVQDHSSADDVLVCRCKRCHLRAASSEVLASVLTSSQHFKEFDVRHSDLGEGGRTELCQVLASPNCKWQRLRLRCYRLTSRSCEKPASCVPGNQILRELRLDHSDIGEVGLAKLCQAPKLQVPGLESCGLTEACRKGLCAALRMNQALPQLDLYEDEALKRRLKAEKWSRLRGLKQQNHRAQMQL